MSISITGAGRVTSATAEPHPPAASTVTARASVSLVVIDQATQLPVPPRFPWLSRLAAALEPAAKQKPPFATQPMLGDHLDQSA